MTEIQNLDAKCAKAGRRIVEDKKEDYSKSDIKNPIQKSLGVLQEDGIYAFTVYLASEGGLNESNEENKILKETLGILNIVNPETEIETDKLEKKSVFEGVQEFLDKNLDEIFLAKDLMEKTLIYARYHAKALSDNQKKVEE